MLDQQESHQKKAAIQKKINEKRIDDMHQTQTKLREKFIQVNDFMKQCLGKTTRAENQISHELEQQGNLRKEIAKIERDLHELTIFEEKFKKIIEEFKPYEDVFNEVIKCSDTFESFEDLMGRCDALSEFVSLATLLENFFFLIFYFTS